MTRLRITISIFLLLAVTAVNAQQQSRRIKAGNTTKETSLVKNYEDSLKILQARLDSLPPTVTKDARYSLLFMPFTFYHSPAHNMLRLNQKDGVHDSLEQNIDRVLMDVYLRRPDLVKNHESHLDVVGAPLVSEPKTQKTNTDIVKQVAPKVIEPEVVPMDILVIKPNFWTFAGDYYLQFLQNYVSGNWYKGGESSYSMLGSITMQANYNNKQKVKWDNKLELKLGYQTTRGDSIHRYKASEDLIRYTSKLGLQATKKWYYTFQMIAQTQFTYGVKNNDERIYSDFMSPFNLNLSVGMDYTVDWCNHKLKGSANLAPLALNWKYVGRLDLATRYGLEEGNHSLTDYGSELTIDLTWILAENMKWKTRLYGYTTYKRAELEWENTLTFQFNRYISTNIFVYPRFDDGATRDSHHGYWQFKEYCSIGFSYSF